MNQDLFNGQGLTFLSLIISIGTGLMALFATQRRNPPIDAQFATKSELAQMKGELAGQATAIRSELSADIRNLFQRIETVTHELNTADERRTETLRHEIKELAVALARIKP